MVSSVRRSVSYHGDPFPRIERFRQDPGSWLPAPARPAGPYRWSVTLEAGALHRDAIVEVGEVWSIETVDTRAMRWWGEPPTREPGLAVRYLPVFTGGISLRRGVGELQVQVAGQYEPPGGPLGTVLDGLGGRQLALTTLDRFVEVVLQRLSEPAPIDDRR